MTSVPLTSTPSLLSIVKEANFTPIQNHAILPALHISPSDVTTQDSSKIPVLVTPREPSNHQHNVKKASTVNLSNLQPLKFVQPSSAQVKVGLLNAQSVKNKALDIIDHVNDNNLDLVALTETWLTDNDTVHKAELTSNGFTIHSATRKQKRGGGVALLVRSPIHSKRVTDKQLMKSFEYVEVQLKTKGRNSTVVVLYRPPPNHKNKLTVPMFIEEFSNFLEKRITNKENLCILGDFNFHVNNDQNNSAAAFLQVIESFGLTQHVNTATHKKGNILDLVLTRSNDNLVDRLEILDMQMSDHFWIHCHVNLDKQRCIRKNITVRKIKAINVTSLSTELSDSFNKSELENVDTAVDTYNTILSEAIDKHAPKKSKSVMFHTNAPYYNDEIKAAKRERRAAEKEWRKTKLEVHRQSFVEKREEVNALLTASKKSYYLNKITSVNDQKGLFQIINSLLQKNNQSILPTNIPRDTILGLLCKLL